MVDAQVVGALYLSIVIDAEQLLVLVQLCVCVYACVRVCLPALVMLSIIFIYPTQSMSSHLDVALLRRCNKTLRFHDELIYYNIVVSLFLHIHVYVPMQIL